MTPEDKKPPLFVINETARILLADDDPILREFASVHLTSPTASIETVADGGAAWDRLRASSFDLAMLDIDMPHFNGFELLKMIHDTESLSRLPVVMITGREDIKSIDTAFQLGATSFVTKPVNWRQLSYQLRYVFRMSRMEQAARAALLRAKEVSTLKSNLLSVLGHEFRTPLNTIIGLPI